MRRPDRDHRSVALVFHRNWRCVDVGPSDQLATPIARDGDALSVHIEDTDTNFAVGWQGNYRIDGAAFVFRDNDSGNVRTILGYPTDKIMNQISNMFG